MSGRGHYRPHDGRLADGISYQTGRRIRGRRHSQGRSPSRGSGRSGRHRFERTAIARGRVVHVYRCSLAGDIGVHRAIADGVNLVGTGIYPCLAFLVVRREGIPQAKDDSRRLRSRRVLPSL